MTPEQHVEEILAEVRHDVRTKYKAGQEEHGGKLWRKPIMNYMGEEITDLVVYWYTFRDQWYSLRRHLLQLEEAIGFNTEIVPDWVQADVEKACNLMLHGNWQGKPEEERNG